MSKTASIDKSPKNKAAITNADKSITTDGSTSAKQHRITQTRAPLFSLEDALKIPNAIKNELAGQANVPLMVAKACGMSPTSSQWRLLSSAAVAYGLTTGAYNAKEIGLTPLGSRIVSPLKEGDDILAMKEATIVPTLFKELTDKYDQSRLPREDIALNVIANMGIPTDRLTSAWSIFKTNAKFAGLLQMISGNDYLYYQQTTSSMASCIIEEEVQKSDHTDYKLPQDVMERMNITPISERAQIRPLTSSAPNIYISHGKNSTTIVGQLKELISYGQMHPIVSVEHETTAIPVPTKVFDDMRSCDAGIIHVNLEEHNLADGTVYAQINENVLIEIGAAMALYGNKVILLCEQGTTLPSNLQGLYRCEYGGTQLDYSSTIKLLKAMQEIRQKIVDN